MDTGVALCRALACCLRQHGLRNHWGIEDKTLLWLALAGMLESVFFWPMEWLLSPNEEACGKSGVHSTIQDSGEFGGLVLWDLGGHDLPAAMRGFVLLEQSCHVASRIWKFRRCHRSQLPEVTRMSWSSTQPLLHDALWYHVHHVLCFLENTKMFFFGASSSVFTCYIRFSLRV